MNILIICDKFLPISEQFVYNQLKVIENHDIYIICRKQENLKLYPFNFKRMWVWYNNLFTRLKIKTHKNVHVPNSLVNKTRHIIKEHKIDLLYFHFGTTAVKYQDLIEGLNIPIFCAFHGFDATRKLKDAAYINAVKKICDKINTVIVPSNYIKDLLTTTIGINKNKVAVVRFGPDLKVLDQVEVPNKNNQPITILHAGRLVPKKGVPDLVKVFVSLSKKFDNIELVLAGGGEQYHDVKNLIKESKLKNIKMTNAISYQNMLNQYKKADIFVLNSRKSEDGDMEGLPNTIMEAMAFRIPVISTIHSGIPELITDKKNGILVEPRNNQALEAAMDLLINNKELRDSLGNAGRETIESAFNLDIMRDSFFGLLKPYETITK